MIRNKKVFSIGKDDLCYEKPKDEVCFVDVESPRLLRTYRLRESTLRKLNELKATHPNIGICVSTLVDTSIEEYYKKIKSEGFK